MDPSSPLGIVKSDIYDLPLPVIDHMQLPCDHGQHLVHLTQRVCGHDLESIIIPPPDTSSHFLLPLPIIVIIHEPR